MPLRTSDCGRLPAAAAFLSLLLAAPLGATPLTPEQAVARALAHNPDLAAAAARRDAATQLARAETGARLPRLDLRHSWRRGNDPLDAFADKLLTRRVTAADFDPVRLNDPEPSTLAATELALAWPLYTGGRRSARIRARDLEAGASRHQWRRRRARLVFQVRRAYLAAQAAQQAVRIARDARDAARRHARTTATLLAEGRIVRSDRLTAQVYLAATEGALVTARGEAGLARQALQRLMGEDPDGHLALRPWQDPEPGPLPDLTGLEARALARRADYAAAGAVLEAGTAEVEAARSAYRPQVTLQARRAWYDDDPALSHGSWRVLGTVGLNLFAGGARPHQVAAARARREARAREREALRLAILEELRAAHTRLGAARERLRIHRAHLDKARRTVELVNERYGQGRTLLIDLLQAERALVETRRAALQAGLDLSVQRLALALAAGELDAAP